VGPRPQISWADFAPQREIISFRSILLLTRSTPRRFARSSFRILRAKRAPHHTVKRSQQQPPGLH
jgi:hypothetical protein